MSVPRLMIFQGFSMAGRYPGPMGANGRTLGRDIYSQGTRQPATKSIDSAAPLVMLIMSVLNAVSGICLPDSLLPSWLRDVTQALVM